MPAWNAARFIAPVLESLAAQTYPELEIRISVDACDDATAEICTDFALTRPRVRVTLQPTRLGWIGNANHLLADADGEYLFFAFHDDPLDPCYVERLVDALERRPDAVLAFSDVRSNRGDFSYCELDGVDDRWERARRMLLQRGEWWVPNRGLIRTRAAAALGGMRRHLAGEVSADLPWLLRLALLGPFEHVRAPLITKTFRTDGLASRWRTGAWSRLAVELACVEAVCRAGFTKRQTLALCAHAAVYATRTELWHLKQRVVARTQARAETGRAPVP